MRCLQALGFGPRARRWVSLLHEDTCSHVMYNGWRTPAFPVRSGLAQGSPLSPILYVIAAQPLASYMRHEAAAGAFRCISLPDGSQSPPCHQHADDTTIHVQSREDAQVALEGSVALFCRATGGLLNRSKSQGLTVGSTPNFSGPCPLTGIEFNSREKPIRHLGILVGHDPDLCATAMFDRIKNSLARAVAHWSAKNLSFLGRVHVAKQALASRLWYFATFITPPKEILKSIVKLIYRFIVGKDPASPISAIPALHPNRSVSSLPYDMGGLRLVDVPTQIAALQAKLIARVLEPERHPWKILFSQWLYRPAAWFTAQPAFQLRVLDRLKYGIRLVFSKYSFCAADGIPLRQMNYINYYRSLHPHRVGDLGLLTFMQVLQEPLLYNTQILDASGDFLVGNTGVGADLLSRGVNTVRDLARVFVDIC